MSVRSRSAWVVARSALVSAGGLVASSAALVVACSSDDVASSTGTQVQCLPTLGEANGSACASEGASCPYRFACGGFEEQTACTCVHGFFTCAVYGEDAALPTDAAPACSPQTNPAACPAGEPLNQAACPSLGLECLYQELTCPGADGGPGLDTCACQEGLDGGLVFQCVDDVCFTLGTDAGTDAAIDSSDATPGIGDGGDDAGDDRADAG